MAADRSSAVMPSAAKNRVMAPLVASVRIPSSEGPPSLFSAGRYPSVIKHCCTLRMISSNSLAR